MTDIFFFYNDFIKSSYELILSAIFIVIVNDFLKRYAKKYADELKGSKLLVLTGNLNILINISMLFAIFFLMFGDLQMDYSSFKLFYIIFHLITPISSLITYGVFLTIFGVKNKGNLKSIPIATGFTLSISYLLQIISTILYGIFLLDYAVYQNGYSSGFIWTIYTFDLTWAIYLILINLSITTYLFGVTILFGHSRMNDLKWLSAAMFLLLIHFILMTNLYWIIPRIQNLLGGG